MMVSVHGEYEDLINMNTIHNSIYVRPVLLDDPKDVIKNSTKRLLPKELEPSLTFEHNKPVFYETPAQKAQKIVTSYLNSKDSPITNKDMRKTEYKNIPVVFLLYFIPTALGFFTSILIGPYMLVLCLPIIIVLTISIRHNEKVYSNKTLEKELIQQVQTVEYEKLREWVQEKKVKHCQMLNFK